MNYEIRFCALEEYELLIHFIKEYWNENHIFVKSKQALDFQHLDKKNKRYNFIIAYNTTSKEFDAILGFILLSQYTNDTKDKNLWLSIWKSSNFEAFNFFIFDIKMIQDSYFVIIKKLIKFS